MKIPLCASRNKRKIECVHYSILAPQNAIATPTAVIPKRISYTDAPFFLKSPPSKTFPKGMFWKSHPLQKYHFNNCFNEFVCLFSNYL